MRTLLTNIYFFIQFDLLNAFKDNCLQTDLPVIYFFSFLENLIRKTAYSLSNPSILIIHHFNFLGFAIGKVYIRPEPHHKRID